MIGNTCSSLTPSCLLLSAETEEQRTELAKKKKKRRKEERKLRFLAMIVRTSPA